MKILWCITGAGQFLKECVEILDKNNDVKTVAISEAGEDVLKMYGIKPKTEHKILEKEQGKAFPFCGKVCKGDYDLIIAAPVTSNTVAKLAYGISDSLITVIITQAIKSAIPVYLLPTDISEGYSITPKGRKIYVKVREIDKKNIERIAKQGIKILKSPEEIKNL
ncbi:MAG: flavoprotein [Candidatus Altiarchaeales archaeon HGW-Altiarchaeales-1]|nr:MAG: flavoprotein [Candidatus Altiarchaeales archaeon HGW-Altiarchaeales-1]